MKNIGFGTTHYFSNGNNQKKTLIKTDGSKRGDGKKNSEKIMIQETISTLKD